MSLESVPYSIILWGKRRIAGSPLHRKNMETGQKNSVREKNTGNFGNFGNFRNFTKTQGILFAQVVNSLVLKVKDTVIFAAKICTFILKLEYVCHVSFVYVIVTTHRTGKIGEKSWNFVISHGI